MTFSTDTARFSLEQVMLATNGKAVGAVTLESPVQLRAWTDTRTLTQNDLFIPLVGARFDGHNYLAQALANGAFAALVQADRYAQHPEWQALENVIVVPDTLTAYLQIARFHRQRMTAKVIGVAGSNGKTTTKEMLASAFSAIGPTQCTFKNHNNEVGVSQTLLSIQPDTQFMVVEMAMRGPDEIRLLSQHCLPDIALVLNIGPEHVAFFGSLDAIADAECEIFEGLNPGTGIALINDDDTLLVETTRKLWQGKTASFHLNQAQDVTVLATGGMQFEYDGHPVTLSVSGWHNLSNALAVLQTGRQLDCDLERLIVGLEQFKPVEGRGNRTVLEGYHNAWVINDAYNANPASMQASIEAFLKTPAANMKRFLVLGAMKELGPLSRQYHAELGAWLANQTGIDALYTYDQEGDWLVEAMDEANYPVLWTASRDQLIQSLQSLKAELNNSILFLKGSRECALEEIPKQLLHKP